MTAADPDLARIGLFVLAAGAILAPVGVQLVRHISPERRVFFARWGFRHVIGVVATGFLLSIAAGAFVSEDSSILQRLYLGLVVLGGCCAAATLAARLCEPDPAHALGLAPHGNLRALAAGFAGLLFFAPFVLGAQLAWPWTYELLSGAEWRMQEVAEGIGALEGLDLVQACIIAVVVQPFLEELLFRGFLQPLLVQNLSDKLGIVVTSILFALLHGMHAFFPIFLLSLVIGGVMLRTRRLSAAWLVHGLHNASSLALFLLGRELTGHAS